MAIDGFKVVGVSDNNIVAISAGFIIGDAHAAVKCGAHSIAHMQTDVDTFVHAFESRTVAVWRAHRAGMRHVVS